MKVLCGRDDEKRRDESFDFFFGSQKIFFEGMSEKDEREKKKISFFFCTIKSEKSKVHYSKHIIE